MQDIEIKGLEKRYGGKIVLKNLSITLRGGETTVLMGPSGCGKTTLLRLIAGLEAADGGEITGFDREKMAMVFQEDRLLMHLSALKNAMLVARGAQARLLAQEILTELGLAEALFKPVSQLSGGMARRVAIARALAADAEAILMDEPFKGLDEDTRLRVMECVRARTRGKTLIVVTHDPEEAEKLGGRVARLQNA